jgi:hypothetical protein
MAEFTPGPWTAAPTGEAMRGYSQPFGVASVADPTLVAGVFGDVRGGEEAARANARLIAAAPDLLAALKALTQDSRFNLAIGGNPHAVDALVKQVDLAIAKAEGTTHGR